jgi:hypothetical protein
LSASVDISEPVDWRLDLEVSRVGLEWVLKYFFDNLIPYLSNNNDAERNWWRFGIRPG